METGSKARKTVNSQFIRDHTGLHSKHFKVYLQEIGSHGEIKAERACYHTSVLKFLLIG